MDLRKNTPLNLAIYGTATVGTIVGELTGAHGLVYVCKPLMMLVLSSWFFYNSRRVGDRFTLLVQAGLIFSLVGDIALMFQHLDEFNFLIGLGAFLIAQLCFAMGFLQNILDTSTPRGWLLSGSLSVLLLAYGYFFASTLLPSVDEAITGPVMVYAAAITFMGIMAAFRFGRTFLRSFLFVLIGALLFILSDTLLATDRFLHPLHHARWSVLLTYSVAQLLIASGALMHVLDPAEIRRKAALNT